MYLSENLPVAFFVVQQPVEAADPCNPSPCGPNAQCRDGICTCLPEYQGDPYSGCRPECTMNSDCARVKSCINQKCRDPCPGTCGQGARCDVINHVPSCTCPEGYTGDPFTYCRPVPAIGKYFNMISFRHITIGIHVLLFFYTRISKRSLPAIALWTEQHLSHH